jgi:molybdate/tungstate transport system substrate-binding protein
MDILLREDVTFSRSDPDSDPGGYRTVFTFKLAEKYYGKPGLADKFMTKNKDFIRPKEVDLVALIESNAVDYIFQYKSVAIQHNLKYIELPVDINLGNPLKNDIYNTVSLDVTGSSPGSKITIKGEYINYSLAVLKDAPHSAEAVDFTAFLLSRKGMEIFKKYGQKPIIPFSTEAPDKLPGKLRELLDSYKSEKSGNDQI